MREFEKDDANFSSERVYIMIEKDIAIIGAGPAGIFAVFQAGMLGMNCALLDTLEFLGGQCSALYPQKPIYDIPGFPSLDGQQLIDNLVKQAMPFAPHLILGDMVTKLAKEGEYWHLTTAKGQVIKAKGIIIAAGGGSFGPNKPPLVGIDDYENKGVFYYVNNRSAFADKRIMIAGGGDSALDWALSLAEIAAKVYVVHRRDKFRALPQTINTLMQWVERGNIELVIPYQLHALKGDKQGLKAVSLIDLEGGVRDIEVDALLPFFGLAMELGPLTEWGLNFDKKHIAVIANTMQTNIAGVYAIGDVASYPGKLKLILTGFAEAAIACHSLHSVVYPDKALHFEYSTTKGIPSV